MEGVLRRRPRCEVCKTSYPIKEAGGVHELTEKHKVYVGVREREARGLAEVVISWVPRLETLGVPIERAPVRWNDPWTDGRHQKKNLGAKYGIWVPTPIAAIINEEPFKKLSADFRARLIRLHLADRLEEIDAIRVLLRIGNGPAIARALREMTQDLQAEET